jgi:hypothetical protein
VKDKILEHQLVAIALADSPDLDDLAAEALGHLDEDLRLAGHIFFLRGDQLVELGDTRLRLGLAGLGALPDPFELMPDGRLAAAFLALFLLEALGLLLE